MEIGASFSHRHLLSLGLDPKKALVDFKKLGLGWIRLGCYWDEIEKSEGIFNFKKMDLLVEYCQKNNLKIVMTVGMKAPRYPEYYLPDWIAKETKLKRLSTINIKNKFLLEKTLIFIGKVVNHYKKYSAVKVWQIENEPLDNSGEKWWRIGKDFLEKEVNLVRKIDGKRKILVNTWGNELTKRKTYKNALKIADILGLDIYTKVPVPLFKFFRKYIGPLDSRKKIKKVVDEINSNQKKFWIVELQAEPWEPDVLVFQGDQAQSFLPEQFEKNLNFAKELKPEVILLWGFEYWYWRMAKGDFRYWNEARKLINNRLLI